MKQQNKICKKCGKKFFKKDFLNRGNSWDKRKYCSLECYWKGIDATKKVNHNPKRYSNETILCGCGCGTLIKKYDYRARIKRFVNGHGLIGKKRPPFSQEWLNNLSEANRKSGKKLRGVNHWNWHGGVSRENHRRENVEYKMWRQEVYRRDYWTCQDCGKKQKKPVAHHLKSWDKFPELRYKVSNGIIFCRPCHNKRH